MSLFGTPSANPGGLFGTSSTGGGTTTAGLFGGATQTTGQQQQQQQQPSLFGATATPNVGTTSLFGSAAQQPTKSLFGGTTGASTSGFGATAGRVGSSTTGTKKFLPGRPSLQDVLSVAPSWKPVFDEINKEISERDGHIAKLKGLVRDLRTKNEAQKALLTEKLEVSKTQNVSGNCIESEIDALQPTILKLQRQCTALSSSCERTMGPQSNQPLVVPQPEYLRFVNDIMQRVQTLQERADSLARSVSLLSDELRGSASSPASEIKTTLT